ncbi:MAG: hypothetical protein IT292_03695 [Deltaproteobacteria bacterium]|nr:hypothetical protein [Deltaproteobacteria bacterium]
MRNSGKQNYSGYGSPLPPNRAAAIEISRKIKDLSFSPKIDDEVFNELSALWQNQKHKFDSICLSQMVCLIAKRFNGRGTLNQQIRSFLSEISKSIKQAIDSHNAWSLANIAWGFAKLGLLSPTLMDAIATSAQRKISEFNAQGLANTVWAFAALGMYEQSSLFLNQASSSVLPFSKINLYQLHIASIVSKTPLCGDLAAKASDVLEDERENRPTTNAFESTVKLLLTKLAIYFEEKVFVDGYFIDFVIRCNDGKPIALECDGDQHHDLNGNVSDGLIGHDRIRDVMLGMRGYRVIHLPFSDYDSLPEEKRVAWLVEKLR